MADSYDEAMEAILSQIKVEAARGSGSGYAERVRDLAEAYAWLISPAQPHGGSSNS